MSNVQRRQLNPIEQRKQEVRHYSRNALLWTSGGLIGGIVLGALASEITLFAIIFIVGLIGGFINWRKVQQIVNYRDPQ